MKKHGLIALALFTSSMLVNAIELGEITVNSRLNEPFSAAIPLKEVESVQGPMVVSVEPKQQGLTAHISIENNQTTVQLASETPIKEPALTFNVTVASQGQEAFKQFTALLDIPFTEQTNAVRRYYGPTEPRETLWAVAESVKPSNRFSVHQTMVALFLLNPHAFLAHNMNGLQAGKNLKIPTNREIQQVSLSQTLSTILAHNKQWLQYEEVIVENTDTSNIGDANQEPVASESKVLNAIKNAQAKPQVVTPAVVSNDIVDEEIHAVIEETVKASQLEAVADTIAEETLLTELPEPTLTAAPIVEVITGSKPSPTNTVDDSVAHVTVVESGAPTRTTSNAEENVSYVLSWFQAHQQRVFALIAVLALAFVMAKVIRSKKKQVATVVERPQAVRLTTQPTPESALEEQVSAPEQEVQPNEASSTPAVNKKPNTLFPEEEWVERVVNGDEQTHHSTPQTDLGSVTSELDEHYWQQFDERSQLDISEDELRLIGGMDTIATKLDLARAYIDMNDQAAAKKLIDQVLAQGDEHSQADAKRLLARLS